jgi:pectinesterase
LRTGLLGATTASLVAGGTVGPVGPAHAVVEIVVAADGSGQVTTVQAAVDRAAVGDTVVIRPGTYRGTVTIPATRPGLTLRGATGTATDVVLTESRPQGSSAQGNATVAALARDLTVRDLTIRNDYDEAANGSSQALALYTTGDRQVFRNVRLIGNQDTLQTKAANGATARQYVVDSYVAGDVDFVYGSGTAVFDNCEIRSLSRGSSSNNGYVTAAATSRNTRYGLLFVRSRFTSDAPAGTVYLGRPWHPSGDVNAVGQVLVRESELGAHIRTAQPWTDMSGFSWRTDARFAEYRNTGPGAGVNANRPQLADAESGDFTAQRYLAGTDGWNPVS